MKTCIFIFTISANLTGFWALPFLFYEKAVQLSKRSVKLGNSELLIRTSVATHLCLRYFPLDLDPPPCKHSAIRRSEKSSFSMSTRSETFLMSGRQLKIL